MSGGMEMHDLLVPKSDSVSLRQSRPTWNVTRDLQLMQFRHLLNQPRSKQFFKFFLRWVMTAVLISLFIIIAKIYEAKGNFPHGLKTTYNTLITGLGILLALNFVVCLAESALFQNEYVALSLTLYQDAFKELAKILKLRFGKWKDLDSNERELITDLESFSNVAVLGFKTSHKARILPFCITWVGPASATTVSPLFWLDYRLRLMDDFLRDADINLFCESSYN